MAPCARTLTSWLVPAALVGCGEAPPEPTAVAPAAASAPAVAPGEHAEPPPPPSCDRCTTGACSLADARACGERSEQHRTGRGAPFDLTAHARFAELACVHGDAPMCSKLALLYQDGIGGMAHSDTEAAKWHERGCTAGAGIGCFNLAMMYESGELGVPDPALAKPWYDKAAAALRAACDAGDVEWCANLGYMQQSGTGMPRDPEAAVATYRRGCPGHQNNCANLALMMIAGEGTPKDVEGGMSLLRDGCGAGSSWACAFLGQELLRSPVRADAIEGVRRLTEACAFKEKQACSSLGYAHAVGLGAAADRRRAAELFAEACSLGDSNGCRSAADEYMNSGREGDGARLREVLDAGCRIGDGTSCGAFALMLDRGMAGDTDHEAAKTTWALGCRYGDLASCDQVLAAGMAPEVPMDRRAAVVSHACKAGVAYACAVATP